MSGSSFKKIFNKITHTCKRARFTVMLNAFLKENSKCQKDSPLILIWEMGGFPAILRKNAILSLALNVRGYNTHFIVCDGVSEVCINCGIGKGDRSVNEPKDCEECLQNMRSMAKKYGVTYSLGSDYINYESEIKLKEISERVCVGEIKSYQYLGVKVGEYALASYLRWNKNCPVDYSCIPKDKERIYRKYFYGSLVNACIANQVIIQHGPVSVFSSHGVFIDYAPPIFLAFAKGINAMSWISGYKIYSHYYSKLNDVDGLWFKGMSRQEWEKRRRRPLSEKENRRLDKYFSERCSGRALSYLIEDRPRRAGSFDDSLHQKPAVVNALKSKLGINNDNPIVCLFSHVNWDAIVDFSSMIFEDADKWLIESISKMIELKDVNWIIKIHPDEKVGCFYSAGNIIKDKFKHLPSHIKILENDTEINAYELFKLINAGITIMGTVGVELPMMGKPVIVAGQAYYSGKGFSVDARSKEEYFSTLEKIGDIKPLTEDQVKVARQFAYSIFIQRQIPLNVIIKTEGHWGDLDLDRLDELLPGRDPVLDIICDGIVNGKDVILDEKTIDKIYRDTSG